MPEPEGSDMHIHIGLDLGTSHITALALDVGTGDVQAMASVKQHLAALRMLFD